MPTTISPSARVTTGGAAPEATAPLRGHLAPEADQPAYPPLSSLGGIFLLDPAFHEHDARPTFHEWAAAKRIERARDARNPNFSPSHDIEVPQP